MGGQHCANRLLVDVILLGVENESRFLVEVLYDGDAGRRFRADDRIVPD